jgi:galactonate dehydratase
MNSRACETGAASILQMNLGRVGGILEAKEIAGMAEAHYAQIAPHLYCGPIVGAANIQLATAARRWEDGFVIPPKEPGLGVELNEEVALAHPWTGAELHLMPRSSRVLPPD